MLASAALLIQYRSGLNFMLDDWAFVIYREDGDLGDFFDPHNEHISILPVAIYKLFLSLFGMESAMPLQVFSVLVFLLSVFVLFLYLKPLVGTPTAVIGCAVILFLGAAWEDLLWAFQIGFSISMAAGVGSLIMLRRGDALGDRVACLLLVVAMISTSLGIPFMIGAALLLLLQRENLTRRLYVVVVPLAVYGAWYLGWGQTAESALSFGNVLNAPEYIARSFSLTVTEVTGLSRVVKSTATVPSLLVGLLAVVAIAIGVKRQAGIPRLLLVAGVIALAFWGLAALNTAPGRGFEASRYQFPNAVFMLMILASAFEGTRPRTKELVVLALIAVVAVAVNLEAMRSGYTNVMKPLSDKGITGLTAIGIARETVEPGLEIGMNQDDTAKVTAGAYFAAEDKYGSPVWSESEIAESSGFARTRIDQILVAALPISARAMPNALVSGSCRQVQAGVPGSAEAVPLPERRFSIRSEREVFLAVGRYSDGVTTGAALVEPDVETLLRIPRDLSDKPWRVGFFGEGEVRVCTSVKQRRPGSAEIRTGDAKGDQSLR